MVKKIHIVRKSRRRSRRRSPRKSNTKKTNKRRSRRKSNTKKLKGGTQEPPTSPPKDIIKGDIIMTLKEYLIPHGGIGKPEVIKETSYSMSPEEQTQILNKLQIIERE
tara:strand:- start:319 stop:642 length:324 start_codon:yes stop_codon:yes gene_type:complete